MYKKLSVVGTLLEKTKYAFLPTRRAYPEKILLFSNAFLLIYFRAGMIMMMLLVFFVFLLLFCFVSLFLIFLFSPP